MSWKAITENFLVKIRLLLGIHDEYIPAIEAISVDHYLVVAPVKVGIRAAALKSLFWVFRARPPDKPNPATKEGEETPNSGNPDPLHCTHFTLRRCLLYSSTFQTLT